ncbi:MAG: hypothetical protein R3C42_01155 [Parvularculaceae bacterium]
MSASGSIIIAGYQLGTQNGFPIFGDFSGPNVSGGLIFAENGKYYEYFGPSCVGCNVLFYNGVDYTLDFGPNGEFLVSETNTGANVLDSVLRNQIIALLPTYDPITYFSDIRLLDTNAGGFIFFDFIDEAMERRLVWSGSPPASTSFELSTTSGLRYATYLISDGLRSITSRSVGFDDASILGNASVPPLFSTGLILLENGNSVLTQKTASALYVDFSFGGGNQSQWSSIGVLTGSADFQTGLRAGLVGSARTQDPLQSGLVLSSGVYSQPTNNFDPNGNIIPNSETHFYGGSDAVKDGVGFFVLGSDDPHSNVIELGKERLTNGQIADFGFYRIAAAALPDENQPDAGIDAAVTTIPNLELSTRRPSINYTGFAAGLLERTVAGSTDFLTLGSASGGPNLSYATKADLNLLGAEITLDVRKLFNFLPNQPSDQILLAFGSFDPDDATAALLDKGSTTGSYSAFVERNLFGARLLPSGSGSFASPDRQGGFIHGASVANALPTDRKAPGAADYDYEYVQWGFFFADSTSTTGDNDHVHMGTWVAGEITPAAIMTALGNRGIGFRYEVMPQEACIMPHKLDSRAADLITPHSAILR